jgi:adenosylcobinamide kinase/adenosylcobinamide-phosphate guanylyltransferase
MSLVVITGGARSGKSSAAERMAASRGKQVIVAVAGRADDAEMARRIAEHRAARPGGFEVVEVDADTRWVDAVPTDTVLVVECLATLIGAIVGETALGDEIATAEQESHVHERALSLARALAARVGDTVVVTNECGSGVVPSHASGRLFRDVLGRANRLLVESADVACLVVAGRCVDLKGLAATPAWPGENG